MTGFVLQIFLLSQTVLVVLDLFDLYLEKKKDVSFSLIKYYRPLSFLAIVWIGYFVIQMFGTFLLSFILPTDAFINKTFHLVENRAQELNAKLMFFFILSFYVVSFWDFLSHRFVLHTRTFWIFHEYHHLSKIIMNATPGINSRPYAILATFLTNAGTALTLSLPFHYFLSGEEKYYFITVMLPWFFVFLALVLSLTHSSFLRKFSWTDRILGLFFITGTKEHLIHHSIKGEYNYGNFCIFWDKLFRSYVDPKTVDFSKLEIGLSYDQDYLGTLCLGKWKMSSDWRKKFGVSDSVNTKY